MVFVGLTASRLPKMRLAFLFDLTSLSTGLKATWGWAANSPAIVWLLCGGLRYSSNHAAVEHAVRGKCARCHRDDERIADLQTLAIQVQGLTLINRCLVVRRELTDKICAPVQNRKPRRQSGSGFKGALDSQTVQIGAVDLEAAPLRGHRRRQSPCRRSRHRKDRRSGKTRTSQCP